MGQIFGALLACWSAMIFIRIELSRVTDELRIANQLRRDARDQNEIE